VKERLTKYLEPHDVVRNGTEPLASSNGGDEHLAQQLVPHAWVRAVQWQHCDRTLRAAADF
jgi:hypothetical protein